MKLTLFSALLVCFNSGVFSATDYEVLFGWKQLDFEFPSLAFRSAAIEAENFIPENNVITGIKVSGNRIFLTVPRWREGVPATLTFVLKNNTTNGSPPLTPYPSWEMQEIGNCNGAFQYVQSMEIDQYNRMWIIDVGRINIFTTPINTCPPKLVIMDLKTDQIIRTHVFPSTVVSYTENFLNDIVVGCKTETDCWAYISDPGSVQIVMYNYEQDKSWNTKGMGIAGMDVDSNATEIWILGKNYSFVTAIDGIALSPLDTNFERLYFCPLSSYSLNYIKTSELQRAAMAGPGNGNGQRIAMWVGKKASQTDGMTIDASGQIYYGRMNNNSIVHFDTAKYLSAGSLNETGEITLVQNDKDLQWADTFAFDNEGFLYFTPNRLQLFIGDTYDFNEINFRVARSFIGQRSYMYSETGGNNSGSKFNISFILFFVISLTLAKFIV